MAVTMVLNEAERLCAAGLLRYVPLPDLESVAQTVTKGMVTPMSVEECVKIIVFHSENTKSLLTRKKITREILFKYLYDNNVLVTASMDKNALIDNVVQLWNSRASTYNLGEFQCVSQPTAPDIIPTKPAAAVPGLSLEEVNELALKFSEWFYKLMNVQDGEGEKLRPEHFWQDCGVYLMMIFPSDTIEVVRKNAEAVVEVLQDIKLQHRLYFNPNLSNFGVKGKIDPHGLVMVFACGTLHQSQDCVGVFEQMFLLARDPFSSNNWKVKSTKLRLKSGRVESVPGLQDENITQLLALPDSS